MILKLPRLYAIADEETLRRRGVGLQEFALGLRAGGVELVQWRAKTLQPRELLEGAGILRAVFPAGGSCRLIMNDRVDLALLAGFDGVHVGQGDLGVEDVRAVVQRARPAFQGRTGGAATFIVGISTHTEDEVRAAEAGSADYVAAGPVFATGSKADAAEVVGLAGVRRARALTAKPLVAIGGVTRQNAMQVRAAGADSVAVISELLPSGEQPENVVRDFLRVLN